MDNLNRIYISRKFYKRQSHVKYSLIRILLESCMCQPPTLFNAKTQFSWGNPECRQIFQAKKFCQVGWGRVSLWRKKIRQTVFEGLPCFHMNNEYLPSEQWHYCIWKNTQRSHNWTFISLSFGFEGEFHQANLGRLELVWCCWKQNSLWRKIPFQNSQIFQ